MQRLTKQPFRQRLQSRLYQSYLWLRYKLFQQKRMHGLVLEELDEISLVVLPDVFNPTIFITGELFISAIRSLGSLYGKSVLDMGSGSGVLSIVAAQQGGNITAVDLNPNAVRATQINGLLNDVTLNACTSDLFTSIEQARFDIILFSPPLFQGVPRTTEEMAFFGESVIARFLSQVEQYLKPDGFALMLISSSPHFESFTSLLQQSGLTACSIASRRQPSELYDIVQIRPL